MSTNRYPPGPKSKLMGLDIGMSFGRDPIAFGKRLLELNSPLTSFSAGSMHIYFALAPELVHEILVTQAKKFHKSIRQKQAFGKFNGNGLVNSDGDFWKRQRKMIQPAFHSRRIRHYADAMVRYAEQQAAGWEDGQSVNVFDEMTQMAMNIVSRTLFSTSISTAEAERIAEAIALLQSKAFWEMAAFVRLPDWLPLPHKRRENQAVHDVRSIIGRIVAERRASGEDTGDLLSILVLAEDADGNRMTDVEARDEAITLFLAGHETTATALGWAWYLLATHPDAEAKLHEEVDRVLGGRAATFEDLPNLTYTEQVFKEALRLYPPAWLFSRQAAEPVTVGGYEIPKGAVVSLYPYITQRDPALWSDPDTFRPERFAPGSGEPVTDYAYFPFGGGPRVCIGNSFAMMEGQLALATIAQRARMRLAPGQGVPELEPLISLRPKGGIRLAVERRPEAVGVQRLAVGG